MGLLADRFSLFEALNYAFEVQVIKGFIFYTIILMHPALIFFLNW